MISCHKNKNQQGARSHKGKHWCEGSHDWLRVRKRTPLINLHSSLLQRSWKKTITHDTTVQFEGRLVTKLVATFSLGWGKGVVIDRRVGGLATHSWCTPRCLQCACAKHFTRHEKLAKYIKNVWNSPLGGWGCWQSCGHVSARDLAQKHKRWSQMWMGCNCGMTA